MAYKKSIEKWWYLMILKYYTIYTNETFITFGDIEFMLKISPFYIV